MALRPKRVDHHHPGQLDVLFRKVDLSLDDTRPGCTVPQPAICACGEEAGAAYYAWRHNRTTEHDTPVIIEFEADQTTVAVDGKDFLYPVFQMGTSERSQSILVNTFGTRILRYAERAWASDEQEYRIALCDLAIHDPDVVNAHYANILAIGGRYGTIFRNAFTVSLPITRDAVLRVWSPTAPRDIPSPDISLADLLESPR
jgi:hypothetical protein